jgi:SAM-dependent methyltransferase
MVQSAQADFLPGDALNVEKMPGHWLLARLGKRVLRPGGFGMTQALCAELAIGSADDVVEFAPGLGVTAQLILERKPRHYVGIERDERAAQWVTRRLPKNANYSVVLGAAGRTGLPDNSASVVLGEAMLSMNTQAHKEQIAADAFRLLRPGGRYGIHELCIIPDDLPNERLEEINRSLSSVIHVGARLLPTRGWQELLEKAGFRVLRTGHAPMHLLRAGRLIEDEGVLGALRLAKNILLDARARRRVLAMRRIFESYQQNLGAVFMIALKP